MLKVTSVSLSALALAGTALAADAESKWVMSGDETAMVMVTSADNAPGMLINCTTGKLQVALSTEGVDLTELKPSNRKNRRLVAEMKIEDREPIDARVVYSPGQKLVVTQTFGDRSKLYNAAVQGKTVTVDMGRRGSFTFTPPPINDTFRSFASSCDATNGS